MEKIENIILCDNRGIHTQKNLKISIAIEISRFFASVHTQGKIHDRIHTHTQSARRIIAIIQKKRKTKCELDRDRDSSWKKNVQTQKNLEIQNSLFYLCVNPPKNHCLIATIKDTVLHCRNLILKIIELWCLSYIMMFRWINKQLRIQTFRKFCIHYQDIYGWISHDNKTRAEFFSNSYKIYSLWG